MSFRKLLHVAIVGGGIAGCSWVVDGNREQCNTPADCLSGLGQGALCVQHNCVAASAIATDAASDGAPPDDPRWACLGKVEVVLSDPNVPINYKVQFLTALSEQPLVGLKWAVCAGIDTQCVSPYAEGTTGADGIMDLMLYKGYRGYFRLQPSETANVKAARLYFVPPPGDIALLQREAAVHLLSKAEFEFITGSMQREMDPEAGHVFGFAFDCENKPAAGVTAAINPRGPLTFGYYSDPNRSPSPLLDQTSNYAEGGFINMPVGSFTMTSNRADNGQRIGTISGYVVKDEITYAPMQPTPL